MFGTPATSQSSSLFGTSTTGTAFGTTTPSTGFGSTTAPAPTGGFNFPTSGTTTQPSFGFGAPTISTAPAPAATGFTFGGTPASTATAPATQPTTSFLGARPAAPTLGAPTTGTGFAFGGFGTSTSTAPATATVAPFGSNVSGGTATVSPFQFGTSTAPTTASVAPQPATSTGSTMFPQFGAPAAATQPQTTPSFGFGTSTTAASTIPTSAPASGLGGFTLQTTSTTTPQVQPLGSTPISSTIGAPTTTTSAFSFGTPAATTSTSQPATTLFGTPATTAATTTTGFNFGTPAAASTPATAPATTTTGFKLTFGAPQPTTTTAAGIAPQPQQQLGQPQTQPTTFTGLGGIQQPVVTSDSNQALAAGSGTAGDGVRSEERTLKDAPVPEELIHLVEELRQHITSEKNNLGDLASTVGQSIEKVSDACENVRQLLIRTENLIHRQILECQAVEEQVEKDKKDTEMADQVRTMTPHLQQETKIPYAYLFNTLQSFHDKIAIYQREISKAEVALKSMDSPRPLTNADLNMALQSTRDSLVFLAARVKTLHEKVETEKESHRSLVRYMKGNVNKGNVPADRLRSSIPRHTGPPLGYDRSSSSIDYLSKYKVLFPSRFGRSPKTYADFLDSNARQRIFHSTQVPQNQMTSSAFNTSGFGQSTMFHSVAGPSFMSEMNTSASNVGSSLKRSKH